MLIDIGKIDMCLILAKKNYKKEKQQKKLLQVTSLKYNKELVHKRSGWTCENPDCNNPANGGVHHIHKSSQGGSNLTHNLFDPCLYCHNCAEGKVKGVIGVLFMVRVLEKLKVVSLNDYLLRAKYWIDGKYIFQESLDYLLHTPGYYKNMKNKGNGNV